MKNVEFETIGWVYTNNQSGDYEVSGDEDHIDSVALATGFWRKEELVRKSDAIAAIEAQGVPDGWRIVPVEPTMHMLYASALDDQMNTGSIRAAWKDMVNAAPPAPQAAKCATCNGNGLIGGPSFYAPDEGGVPCPDCSQAAVVQQEPIGFISPKQVELIGDPECEFGKYIPMRKTPAGNFTLALYTHPAPETKPIDMVLHCPKCGMQHVDAPDDPFYGGMSDASGFHPRWENPPHRSHLCHTCGHIWRPADVPTNGVWAVKTKGKADSPLAAPQAEHTANFWDDAYDDVKASVVQQEPVAWSPALDYPQYEKERVWCNGKPRQEDIDYWEKHGNGITLAYTHTAQQAKQPLTREQRDAVFRTANAALEHGPAQASWEEALIDAVEAAHGIKGERS